MPCNIGPACKLLATNHTWNERFPGMCTTMGCGIVLLGECLETSWKGTRVPLLRGVRARQLTVVEASCIGKRPERRRGIVNIRGRNAPLDVEEWEAPLAGKGDEAQVQGRGTPLHG